MTCQYKQWASQNREGNGYGQCAEITEKMVAVFPELRRVRGHYYCPFWGRREHWWLVKANGEIIDPTATQFPSQGKGTYVEWDEAQPEPTGMCPNCGNEVFDGGTCCSEQCHRDYANYCTNPHNY